MTSAKPRLLAIGGAHIDRRGRVSGTYVPCASNLGTMREEVGGGAFNALRNATGMGLAGTMLSMRGGDAAGEAVAKAVAEWGIADLSAVFLDRATPSYTALLDGEGELIAGLADMGLYDIAFPRQLRRRRFRDAVAEADALLIDANLPAEAVGHVARMESVPIFAIAVSPAKVERMAGALASISCLFMNGREARALAEADEAAAIAEVVASLRLRGLGSGVVTGGRGRIVCFDASGMFTLEPPTPVRVADVTGAGDALAGATVAMLMRGASLREAIRYGAACAVLTVASPLVATRFAPALFRDTLAAVPVVTEFRDDAA